MPSALGKAGIGIASIVGLYSIILGALLTPYLQRFSLYAHKINTLFYHDINRPEDFGFAKNQVAPCNIRTADGEILYAWHILPIDVYARNEAALLQQPPADGPVEDFAKTAAFRLLTSNDAEPARVVVSFHGNAGHVAQGVRPSTYHLLSALPNTHIIAIDYRGFGHSTGSPTETGLIADGVAAVEWVLNVAGLPPERVVILGQSLGTAVASAVGLYFADGTAGLHLDPKTEDDNALLSHLPARNEQPISFAGIVLAAPFSSLPSLMLTYRIGGFIPLLLPLRPFPFLSRYFTSRIVDTWPTAERLARYYSALSARHGLTRAESERGVGRSVGSLGSLQILHAVNDWDITYRQTEMICRRVFDGKGGGNVERCGELETAGVVLDVNEPGRPRVRFEILESGGHNKIVTHSPVTAAVVRAFKDL